MKKTNCTLVALFGALSLIFTPPASTAENARAGQKASDEQSSGRPTLNFHKPLIPVTKDLVLKNGLRVIVSEDHSVPVASLVVIYDVGSRDETKGKSGFAHLFEHMMFEGSENVPKGAFFGYVQSNGGQLNASTHADFTDYFEKLPSNKIELALWLEADRMRSLKVTEENFKNQLETVKEEKRLRIDNQPYMPAAVKAEEMIFDNWHNGHPVIGYFEDLEASKVQDVKSFFDTYYSPNNAVMAIVGDVNASEIESLVRKYFESIPSHQAPERPDVNEPLQTKPKYLKVEDNQAKMPAFWLAWKAPPRRHRDSFVLSLIERMLTSGPSSRLYRRLVKDDQVALKVRGSYEERRGPSEYDIFVVFKPGKDPESIRKIIKEELGKLKETPVSPHELEKAKNQVLQTLFSSASYYSLQRSIGRGERLAQYASFYKDPGLMDADVEAYLKVTPADVQQVAARLFTEAGTTTVDVIPKKEGEKK